MRKQHLTFLAAAGLIFLNACGGGKSDEKNKKEEAEQKTKMVTKYHYQHDSTTIGFVSYKHTDKKPVGGQFDSSVVKGVKSGVKSVSAMFQNAEFTVFTSSINTANPDRDKKIMKHFFGAMKDSGKMTGSVASIEMDGSKGKGKLDFKMNGKEKQLPFKLKLKGNKLMLTAKMDVKDWGADASVAALQKACKELHTGSDGKTKLWSEVKLEIGTVLQSKKKKMTS